jgi:hypothetical protein
VKCYWEKVVDEVKSYEVVLLGFFIIIKLSIIEGAIREQWMDIIIMGRCGKMKVLINYNIYIIYNIIIII